MRLVTWLPVAQVTRVLDTRFDMMAFAVLGRERPLEHHGQRAVVRASLSTWGRAPERAEALARHVLKASASLLWVME